jgi:hypothetical protein
VIEIDDGGLAFPSEYYAEQGMSLRDYFAAAALQGVCVNAGRNGHALYKTEDIAIECYNLADAMIEARKGEA